jgi:predicted dienelactone hydrolase
MVILLCVFLSSLFQTANGATRFIIDDGVLIDADRDREVPYRLYRPAELNGRYPVLIFSHGLGGSTGAAAYLGKNLATHGYVAMHIQHHGSDQTVWKDAGKNRDAPMGALTRSLRDPRNALNRFKDIPFVINELIRLNKASGSIQGHLNLSRIGMAGHSYGGRSTMIAAGERIGPQYLSFKEPRIKAGLVLSPNLPRQKRDLKRAYAEIDIPLFHITGTEDRSPLPGEQNMDPADRTEPFKHLEKPDQYLLVLHGADHMTFSGLRLVRGREKPQDARHITAVNTAALAFFDAYLKRDAKALQWLREEFLGSLSTKDRFIWK